MRYAGIIKDDTAAAPGICVSFFCQGCSRHCEGCHNPSTWDANGGKEFNQETMKKILDAICANGIQRDLCIMGGEPLEEYNLFLTRMIINEVKQHYPTIKIYLWTGYTIKELKDRGGVHLQDILNNIDYLIDGPFELSHRDITLSLRGSANQQIYKFDAEKKFWQNITEEYEREHHK